MGLALSIAYFTLRFLSPANQRREIARHVFSDFSRIIQRKRCLAGGLPNLDSLPQKILRPVSHSVSEYNEPEGGPAAT